MLGKPRIRLNNLKTSLRFPCIGLNPIIDSINLLNVYSYLFSILFLLVANFFVVRLVCTGVGDIASTGDISILSLVGCLGV